MTVSRAALALLALLPPLAAQPVTAAVEGPAQWQFDAFIDIFVPVTTGGTTTYPPSNGSDSIGVTDGVILNSLNTVFIGGFEARRERWGLYVHFLCADLGNTRTAPDVIVIGGQPLPSGADATARLDVRGTFWTIAATYRMLSDPSRSMDLLAGVRFLDCSSHLSWQLSGSEESVPPPSRAGERTTKRSGGDGIVGVKGRYSAYSGSPWFAAYYLDLGTGTSKLT